MLHFMLRRESRVRNNVDELVKYAEMELQQLSQEGCDTWEHERRLSLIQKEAGPDVLKRLRAFCDGLPNLKPSLDFPFDEPSNLEAIKERRPAGPRHLAVSLSPEVLDEKTTGAWQGRIAGCMLGKPVEGWEKAKIGDLMAVCGLDRLDDYLPEPPEGAAGISFPESAQGLLRGNIRGAARDDDIDYPIANLCMLEQHGREFTPRNVADFWLSRMPYACTYTAERAAYRNFVNGVWPTESATYQNPFREWIGAQIRADMFGYACPGRPEEAAALAFKDACISHAKNGIYGEMWVAAMLAAAFVTDDVEKAMRIGLSEIPQNCRLSEAIGKVMRWRTDGRSAEEAADGILEQYGSYHRVHTINNAAIVAMALLWGEKDFSRTIGLAVQAGLDTDCNGATAGSVVGAVVGASGIPAHWIEPFGDRVATVVAFQDDLTISGLVRRTRELQDAC